MLEGGVKVILLGCVDLWMSGFKLLKLMLKLCYLLVWFG